MNKNRSASLTRRDLVSGVGATAIVGGARSAAAAQDLDLSDPATALDAYARLRGSTATETVYQVYGGDIFLSVPGEVQKPLFGFRGLQKANWKAGEDSYISTDYDLGLYVDPSTRAVLDTWDNPFTGKTVEVIHYRSGPATSTLDLAKNDAGEYGRFYRGWQRTQDKLVHESGSAREADNILSPEKYPLGSSGEKLYFSTSYTMIGRASEVGDESVSKAPCSYIWTMLASWPPWMEMGQRPGYVLWRWVGHKVMSIDEVPRDLIRLVEGVWPGYVEEERPWEDVSSGWQQYQWKQDGYDPR